MTKPPKEPFVTPMATRSKLARATGHKPPPDPPGWDTVTNSTAVASQIRKIMAWYELDVHDEVYTLATWTQFHDAYQQDYRANIASPRVQTQVLQIMYGIKFPYVRQGTWGKAMFWMKHRDTYIHKPEINPPYSLTIDATPPTTNYGPAAATDYMIDTSHMTPPLEDTLGDFIMTRSKTRGQTSSKKNH